jgi:hypothetical protein
MLLVVVLYEGRIREDGDETRFGAKVVVKSRHVRRLFYLKTAVQLTRKDYNVSGISGAMSRK